MVEQDVLNVVIVINIKAIKKRTQKGKKTGQIMSLENIGLKWERTP